MGELGLLVLGIDRGLGEQGQFQRRAGRVAILAEAIAVGLGRFLGQTQQGAGELELGGVEGQAAFEEVVRLEDLGGRGLRAVAILSQAGPYFACFLESPLIRPRRASSSRALLAMNASSLSPPRPPTRALREFWTPNRSSFDCRSCSVPRLPYSAEGRLLVEQERQLERVGRVAEVLQVATVFKRFVLPGWPDTNTRSPSFEPFLLHFR